MGANRDNLRHYYLASDGSDLIDGAQLQVFPLAARDINETSLAHPIFRSKFLRLKAIATWIDEASAPFFKWVFNQYPDMRLYDVRIEPAPPWDEVAGLLLTGGSDISEKFLRQPVPDPSLIKNPDLPRDEWEFDVARKALQKRMPILAICRGHQVLNVALDGTLHLDIPGHGEPRQKSNNIQELRFAEEVSFKIPFVNSSHHQAVDKLGRGLKVEAWCKADDVVEQMRLVDYPFGFSVQYHPERDPLYLPMFNAFAQQVRQGAS